MRVFLSIIAILLLLVGAVWFLQGISLIGGSSMTGQSQWAIYGGIAVVVGIVLVLVANRRRVAPTKK